MCVQQVLIDQNSKNVFILRILIALNTCVLFSDNLKQHTRSSPVWLPSLFLYTASCGIQQRVGRIVATFCTPVALLTAFETMSFIFAPIVSIIMFLEERGCR
jgi:hypothetical protein